MFGSTTAATPAFSFSKPSQAPTLGAAGFGSSATPATSLFGAPQSQQPTQQPTQQSIQQSSQQQQQQQQPFSTSMFGKPAAAASTFGQGIQQPLGLSSSNDSFRSTSLLGQGMRSATSGGGSTAGTMGNYQPSIPDQLTKIKDSWDPSSPSCAFQYYFYNKVPTEEAALYGMPAGHNPDKWEQAINKRPDAGCVPVLAVGFSDLQKRLNQQAGQVVAYQTRMHEINTKLDELTTRHDLYSTIKISEIKARHTKLMHRTLSLATKLQVLKNRGYVLKPEEEILNQKLKELNRQMDDPKVFGRINEIWARMSVLRERANGINKQMADLGYIANLLDWERDSEKLEKMAKILKAQQTGIAYLASVLKRDTEEVEKLINSLHGVE